MELERVQLRLAKPAETEEGTRSWAAPDLSTSQQSLGAAKLRQ